MRSLVLTIVLCLSTAATLGLGLDLACSPVEPAPLPPDAAEVDPEHFAPPADWEDAGDVETALACDLETAVCEGGSGGAPWGQSLVDCE